MSTVHRAATTVRTCATAVALAVVAVVLALALFHQNLLSTEAVVLVPTLVDHADPAPVGVAPPP